MTSRQTGFAVLVPDRDLSDWLGRDVELRRAGTKSGGRFEGPTDNFDETAPWSMARTGDPRLGTVLGRLSTVEQSGLLMVGTAVVGATAQPHLSVARLAFVVTLDSVGSPAGWWSCPDSLPPA